MKKDEIQVTLVSKEHHLVINPLTGKKVINNSKQLFWYVDQGFTDYNIKPGIKTKSKAIGVYDVTIGEGVSLKDVFERFPGSLNLKWLSQSQVIKVCKHFRNWLKFDGYTYILCKIREDQSFNPLSPWNNLMVIEIGLDHENDLAVRLVSSKILNNKILQEKTLRLIIPKRTKELRK